MNRLLCSLQVHKLFCCETKSDRPDIGSMGGQTPRTDFRYRSVKRTTTDGAHGRGFAVRT